MCGRYLVVIGHQIMAECANTNVDNGLMTRIWGPSGWLFLHCISFGFPYKIDPTNPEHLDYFKSQYATLLEEMKEIKKTLLKVQTFSMETNLEVMKLKRTINNESVTTTE